MALPTSASISGDDGSKRMAIIGVAGQCLHMGDELAALGVCQRGGNGDLDAELVRPVRLALTDALHFRRVQRIDLGTALALGLIAHAPCQLKDASEHHFLEPAVARDLAGDIANDAAEIGSELLQGAVGALKLLGVGLCLRMASPTISRVGSGGRPGLSS